MLSCYVMLHLFFQIFCSSSYENVCVMFCKLDGLVLVYGG